MRTGDETMAEGRAGEVLDACVRRDADALAAALSALAAELRGGAGQPAPAAAGGDELHPDPLVGGLWHVARALVASGAPGPWPPSATVDEIAAELAGHAGVDAPDLAIASWHDASARVDEVRSGDAATAAARTAERRAQGASSVRSTAAGAGLDADDLRARLAAAYDEIERLAAERDAFEDAAVAGEAARRLATEVGAELERDEWIRARIRRLKTTPPLRAAFKARRTVRDRFGR